MKLCKICNTEKSNTDFHKDYKSKDGLFSYCKFCKKEYDRNKYLNNKDTINKNSVLYQKSRRKTDYNYRLIRNLRSRLYDALKNKRKSGSAVNDLGCSISQLKNYLETKFTNGMNWDNYGKWHIDHIRPLSSFNLSDRKELTEACHYTNLQPLWAEDNIIKGSTNPKE